MRRTMRLRPWRAPSLRNSMSTRGLP
jgi:hypothetical protein